jgi:hypothetical protein
MEGCRDSFVPKGDIKRMASVIMKIFIRFFLY